MKKGFHSRRLIAALMAALLSVNSLPGTVLAEETDSAGQSQAEAVMESDIEELDLTGESQAESIPEETIEEETETALQREEQSDELVDSGTCGENVTWTLDSEGLLTITGTGDMTNYTSSSECPWYSESASIVSIVVGDDVTNIGNYAFENLDNLTTATLGSSVTTIGESAFYRCSSLVSINIPDNAKTIERGAFYGCRSLESIAIPDSVTTIGGSTFYGCTSLTSVNIPKDVTRIGWGMFYGCSGLTNITIPKNVEYIENDAFSYCSNLSEINFECSVPVIWDESFYQVTATAYYPANDSSWTEDVRKNYGGTLTWKAYDRNVIDSGTCGENVTWVLDQNGVLTISGTGDMADYSEADQWSWYEVRDQIVSIVIENGVENIGNKAFYAFGNLTSVDIADSVSMIDSGAFGNCSSLEEIDIPSSMCYIADDAFLGCTSLKAINVEDGTINYSSQDGVLFSGKTLMYCPGAGRQEYTIPEGTPDIGDYAFSDCSDLTSVEIPNSVTEIGSYAFAGCSSLKEIVIPSRVISIGQGAFNNCSGLKTITFEGLAPEFTEKVFDGVTADVYYPADDASWTEEVRQNCGGTLTWISYEAKNIIDSGTCGEKLAWKVERNGVLSISGTGSMNDYLFEVNAPWHAYGNHIASIVIDNGVTNIGDYAFYGLSNMTEMNIPDSVTKIGASAFLGCKGLTAINIPNEVTDIGTFAFCRCSSLTSVNLPENLTHIKNYTFSNCANIESVEIPKGVTYIGESAFSNCKKLSEITFDGSAPQFGESAFEDVTAVAYYPANDASWTEEVRQNYGGTLTWVAKDSKPEEKELTIIQQPESVTGKLGETAVFKVEAEGDGVTYQWQYCNNGSSSWKNSSMTGSTTNSIEVKITKGRIGQKYRCILQDSRDNKLVSEEARIMLAEEKELAITKQPESVTGKIGEAAVFTVEAEGEGVTYQWQYSNSGSSAWKNSSMTGSTTNSIEVKITKGRIGQKYRCILKDSKGNKLTTEEAQIIQAEEKKLAVIQQPESVTGKIGDTATFTVEAEGEGVTYQWQYCNSGSSAWKNSSMTGSTTNSIEVKITKGRIGQKYRCILKDSKGNKLTTEEAQIKLAEEKELAIVKQPESVTGKVGDTAVFTVEAEGEGVTYQWQYCNNGSTSWANSKMTGCDTNSIEVKITKGRIDQKYRCILKDSKGNKLTTEEAQIIQAEK